MFLSEKIDDNKSQSACRHSYFHIVPTFMRAPEKVSPHDTKFIHYIPDRVMNECIWMNWAQSNLELVVLLYEISVDTLAAHVYFRKIE